MSDKIKIKQYTGRELYDIIVDYDLDDPFIKMKEMEKRLKYFVNIVSHDHGAEHHYFCLNIDEKIIGFVKFKVGGTYSLFFPKYNNWICAVSIDKEYQGRGYSKLIIDEMFKFARDNNLSVLSSGYTNDGYLKIRKNMRTLANEYQIDFKDNDRIDN